jgi:hypothetical protein
VFHKANHEANNVWHEYTAETLKFKERRISIIDMLLVLSHLCEHVVQAPPETVQTTAQEPLMALYRNGVSDALYAFNHTNGVFIDEIKEKINEYQVFILSLA